MIPTILLCSLAILLFVSFVASRPRTRHLRPLANIGEGRHYAGKITYLSDAAIATRYLWVKAGSDASHFAAGTHTTNVSAYPIGFCGDSPAAAEEPAVINKTGAACETQLAVASGVIAKGGGVFTDDAGKVQAEPTTAGTYYKLGEAVTAAAADGDVIEIDPCLPQKLVVIAAFTSASTAVGSDAGTTQTLANALKADLAALRTAAGSATLVKVL